MPRLWILSDLHVDVCAWEPPEPRPAHDVVIVAGDVGSHLRKRSLPWVRAAFPPPTPVVYVPGNHDYYRTNLDDEAEKAPAVAEALGIHLLADGLAVEIEGVRIVGATLWSDYALAGDADEAMRIAEREMNDCRKIRTGPAYRKVWPERLREEHRRQLARLEAILAVPFAGPTVVVTHHAPSPRSLGRPPEPLDGAYASDLEGVIGRTQPDLWIHGHIHLRQDYQVGRTRVLANPRGYITKSRRMRREIVEVEVRDFDPALVVDVPGGPK